MDKELIYNRIMLLIPFTLLIVIIKNNILIMKHSLKQNK